MPVFELEVVVSVLSAVVEDVGAEVYVSGESDHVLVFWLPLLVLLEEEVLEVVEVDEDFEEAARVEETVDETLWEWNPCLWREW